MTGPRYTLYLPCWIDERIAQEYSWHFFWIIREHKVELKIVRWNGSLKKLSRSARRRCFVYASQHLNYPLSELGKYCKRRNLFCFYENQRVLVDGTLDGERFRECVEEFLPRTLAAA